MNERFMFRRKIAQMIDGKYSRLQSLRPFSAANGQRETVSQCIRTAPPTGLV